MNLFLKDIYLPDLLLLILGFLTFFFFILVAIISFNEKEKTASNRSLYLSFVFSLPYFLVWHFSNFIIAEIIWIFLAIPLLVGILLLLPIDLQTNMRFNKPSKRIDERNIMFSRKELEEGTGKFEEYYSKYPDKKLLDDKFREAPGLLKPGSSFFDPLMFTSAEATFNTVDALKSKVDGDISNTRLDIDKELITNYIKSWSRYLGAADVGVTRLQDYHLYSHVGRGASYGDMITLTHKYAVAFTVEMDFSMVKHSPAGPIVMESAKEYLHSGMIAVQVADFIRQLGYPARAHIDGNYHVVCPLVAKDAGLGEIGRMGLLMTPKTGPRARISVVTTDLPLEIDEPSNDHTVIDFCNQCMKCADACPSNAIPKSKFAEDLRWQINQEACYTFWCKAGTDCGRCLAVCPYSHPINLLHNFVRWGIKNSFLFRRLAVKFDDFLYSKKPAMKGLEDWMKAGQDLSNN